MDLSTMDPSCTAGTPSTPAVDTFPFMSLPAEIRIMIYDAALPKEVHHNAGRNNGVAPSIRAFMMMKATRHEFLCRLFLGSHFIWHGVVLTMSPANDRQDSFTRYALPFITNLTIHPQVMSTPVLLTMRTIMPSDALLKWMRWRSSRSHLYPWHLKHLKFVAPHTLAPAGAARRSIRQVSLFYRGDRVHYFLLARAYNISGLESLEVILPCYPGAEAARKFFDQCAGKGIVGTMGYQKESRGRVAWLRLENNQVVPKDH